MKGGGGVDGSYRGWITLGSNGSLRRGLLLDSLLSSTSCGVYPGSVWRAHVRVGLGHNGCDMGGYPCLYFCYVYQLVVARIDTRLSNYDSALD